VNSLVLGLGNLLLADEGAGVHAARMLLDEGVPEGVVVLDVGTAVLDALPEIEKAEGMVIIDAVVAGRSAGTIYRMPLDRFERPGCIASMHGFDISRVLALAGSNRVREVVVVGVEPERIEWSLDLSPAVADAMPYVVETVREELSRQSRGLARVIHERSSREPHVFVRSRGCSG
jgi:hydrogenase maturation protease